MIAILGIRYRSYAHYTLCRSCPPIYRIPIVRLLSFLFLDDFEGNAKISVGIIPDFTVISCILTMGSIVGKKL